MTNLEFQTAVDLQRVRLMRAELDALEASSNIGDEGRAAISDIALVRMRRELREWEAALMKNVTIKAPRSDAGRSRKSADAPLLDGQS